MKGCWRGWRSLGPDSAPTGAAPRAGLFWGVVKLRAWRVGVFALPIQVCYFAAFYLGLKTGSEPPLGGLLLLFFSLWLYLAYIVLINDLADREVDASAGKATVERGHALSTGQVVAVVLAVSVLNAAAVGLIGEGVVFDSLWAGAYLLGALYSVPPVSLKRRGAWGLLADSLIEKPLPVLIVFAFFGYYGPEILIFPVMAELLDSVFKHQQRDLALDSATGMRTLAVVLGERLSTKIVDEALHPADVLAVLLGFGIVAWEIPQARALEAAALFLATLLFGYALLKVGGALFESKELGWVDPPYVTLANGLFQVLLVAILGALLSYEMPVYLPLLALFCASTVPYLIYYARVGRRLLSRAGPTQAAS